MLFRHHTVRVQRDCVPSRRVKTTSQKLVIPEYNPKLYLMARLQFKCCIPICRCMQKHNDAIKTNGHSSLEKYTSHFIERVWKGYEGFYCVRGELETEQNCNILTPTLLAITAFLSRSPEVLNREPGGPASAGTWFSFQHLLSNWSELPVAGVI